jgi:hypothetical protein
MIELIALALTVGSAIGGYLAARRFVSDRLRYVDAIQRPGIPLVAGVGAALLAAPVVWLLPLFGAGTALLFGAAVGVGVSVGRREIRRADHRLISGR